MRRSPDRFAVIFSTAGQPLHYHAMPKPQTVINQTLEQLSAALHPVSDVKEFQWLSHQVYDWLIAPSVADQPPIQHKNAGLCAGWAAAKHSNVVFV